MVAYADLILPDTTYLERWDCISLLDRPISDADGAGRRDPPAGGRARPRRARLPGRAARPRRAARLARLRHRRRHAALSRRLSPTTSSTTSARPGIGSLAGLRGADGNELRARRAQSRSSSMPTSPTAASSSTSSAGARATTSTPTGLSRLGARTWASSPNAEPVDVPALSASRCRSSVSRRAGPRRGRSRRRAHRARIENYFDPLPFWYPPFEERRRRRGLSAARHHAAADAHVSLLGLAERLAAADPRRATGSTCTATRAAAARHRRRRLGLDHERASAASRRRCG